MILIAAIAVGAIAAFALFNYVQGIEDRANDQAERVPVYKVAQDIPKGLPGEQATAEGYIVRSEIPREFDPANSTDPVKLQEIGRELNVDTVVEGSVRLAGERVEVRVRLLDAASEKRSMRLRRR